LDWFGVIFLRKIQGMSLFLVVIRNAILRYTHDLKMEICFVGLNIKGYKMNFRRMDLYGETNAKL